jgi:hypothetical protein
MIFTPKPPSKIMSSIMCFPTYIWMTTIWLFVVIVVIFVSMAIPFAQNGKPFLIGLLNIVAFIGFIFCHIYLFRLSAILNNNPNFKKLT